MNPSDDDPRVPPPGAGQDPEPATRVERQLEPEADAPRSEPPPLEPPPAAEDERFAAEQPPETEGGEPVPPEERERFAPDSEFRRPPQTRRAAGERPGRRRPPQPPRTPGARRSLFGRRLIALAIAAGVVLLIVIAFRGCLDARKERGFENYARDVEGIIAQSKQLSKDFFTQIGEPQENTTELSFEAQVASDRGTAENLANRVQDLNAPSELAEAQNDLVLTFELRRDALADISENLKEALAGSGKKATTANDEIADDMRSFLASDVLYDRARAAMIEEFGKEDLSTVNGKAIEEVVPEDMFLPEDGAVDWLEPLDVGSAIAAVAGGTGVAASGTHGVALLQTTMQPGDVILSPDTPVTFAGSSSPQLEVQVQNQGDVDEKGVSVSVSGAGSDSVTIPTIKAGETETAKLSIEAVTGGETASITVTVAPVAGEEFTDNNESTYQVTFG